jgi:hypothetical protein
MRREFGENFERKKDREQNEKRNKIKKRKNEQIKFFL